MISRQKPARAMAVVRRLATTTLAMAGMLFLAPNTWATETLPAGLRIKILMTALSYDRNLDRSRASGLSIGVVYLKGDTAGRASAADTHAAIGHAAKKKVKGLGISSRIVAVQDLPSLAQAIDSGGLNILYLETGLGKLLPQAIELAGKRKILTLCAYRSMVEEGVAFAVVAMGKKPKILVNLPSVQAQGARLDPRLLRLVEVVVR